MDKSLSSQRLKRFQQHNETNFETAFLRYKWNIELSRSLYPSLNLVEVCLRNHLNEAFSTKYGTDWLTNQKALLADQQKQVDGVVADFNDRGKSYSASDVVASLTFGFWTALFSEPYRRNKITDEKIILPAFPNLPRHFRTAESVGKICINVKTLRNRVFHHEPVFTLRDLPQRVLDMENLLKWMNPKVFDFKKTICNFQEIYWNAKPDNQAQHYAVIEYDPSYRPKVLDFLIKEIGKLTGLSNEAFRFSCDDLVKAALRDNNTIRLAIHREEIVGVLFLGNSSTQTLLVAEEWNQVGVHRWLIDFIKERYGSNPVFIYRFENDQSLEKALMSRSAQMISGKFSHPELQVNLVKYSL